MTATVTVTATGTITGYDDLRLLEALACAIGEELNAVGGTIATRLFVELAVGATQAVVESTYLFPSSGRVFIAGAPFTYTSKTDGTLDGLAPEIATLTTTGNHSEVVLDAASIPADYTDEYVSQIERAFRDITPGLSTDPNIRRLAALWGLPLNVDAAQLRAGLQVACFAPRDRRQLLVQFLEAVLSDRNVTAAVAMNPATPQRITAAASTFSEGKVGQWVRIDGSAAADGLYEIRKYISSGAVELNKVPGLLYGLDAASWSSADTGTATLLPFSLEEDPQIPCSVTVRIWQFAGSAVPGSYMQPATEWWLYNFGDTFTQGASIVGSTSGATATIANLVDNVTEGALQLCDVVGTFQDNETITETSGTFGFGIMNGTAGTQLLLFDGEVGGGFALADVVTGAASGMVGTIVGLQDDGAAGMMTLTVSTVAGNGVWEDNEDLEVAATTRGLANGDSRTLERPDGQDAWGYVTSDEREDGSLTRPLYLAGGSADEELQTLLRNMVAAGVWARCRVGGWVE